MGWEAVLEFKTHKDAPIKDERVSKYDSGTYNTAVPSTNAKILSTIKVLENFKLFIIFWKEFTLRTDCQTIVTFYHKKSEIKLSLNRRSTFVDYFMGNGFQVNMEHIKGVDNFVANKLSIMIKTVGKINRNRQVVSSF